jgi:hypothetical protein
MKPLNLTLNISTTLMTRLTEAVERLSKDYADVHAAELKVLRSPPQSTEGKFFYQSDQAHYAAEQKLKEAADSIEI